jgi:hypothetical protein
LKKVHLTALDGSKPLSDVPEGTPAFVLIHPPCIWAFLNSLGLFLFSLASLAQGGWAYFIKPWFFLACFACVFFALRKFVCCCDGCY